MNSHAIDSDISNAVAVLKDGGLILYPTDTIWGIGCDATNEEAVARLFELKSRPGSKAMISLVDSLQTLASLVEFVPPEAVEEMSRSARPLTVILDSAHGISPDLIGDDGSAAFRIPKLEFTRRICAQLGAPLVSTSANVSGEPSAATFDGISDYILRGVDYICRYGRHSGESVPSRIIKVSNGGDITVIRN